MEKSWPQETPKTDEIAAAAMRQYTPAPRRVLSMEEFFSTYHRAVPTAPPDRNRNAALRSGRSALSETAHVIRGNEGPQPRKPPSQGNRAAYPQSPGGTVRRALHARSPA